MEEMKKNFKMNQIRYWSCGGGDADQGKAGD